MKMEQTECSETLVYKITQKKAYNIQNTAKVWNLLLPESFHTLFSFYESEPVKKVNIYKLLTWLCIFGHELCMRRDGTCNCPVFYSRAYSSKYYNADILITINYVSNFKQFLSIREYKTKYNGIKNVTQGVIYWSWLTYYVKCLARGIFRRLAAHYSIEYTTGFNLTTQWYILRNKFLFINTKQILISQIYFVMKLYTFRAVCLSIIRSLFTVHSTMVYVTQVCRQLSSRRKLPLDRHVRQSPTRVCYTRWCINTIWTSWWWALAARNM
jgi:hypothetical protein